MRKIQNLNVSLNIIRISSQEVWAGNVARMGAKRNVYRVLEGRPEGKKPLGKPM
jgi:hypothetical protein